MVNTKKCIQGLIKKSTGSQGSLRYASLEVEVLEAQQSEIY